MQTVHNGLMLGRDSGNSNWGCLKPKLLLDRSVCGTPVIYPFRNNGNVKLLDEAYICFGEMFDLHERCNSAEMERRRIETIEEEVPMHRKGQGGNEALRCIHLVVEWT